VSSVQQSVESLIESLEAAQTDKVEIALVPKHLKLSEDPKVRAAQVSRLSRLLYGKDWKARRVAARLLGRSEDLNQVPDLIFALSDEDPEVPAIAEESLRLLSRKLTVRNLEVNATAEQKRRATEFWKKWYLSIRPDYVFIEK
jgi:HEAT repeat protein